MKNLDYPELRKSWLKRKFASWQYHEDLLKIHDEYLTSLKAHWSNQDLQHKYPDFYAIMKSPIFFNFDMIDKPGTISRESWVPGKNRGWASSISYNINHSSSDFGPPFTEYQDMEQNKKDYLNNLLRKMLTMSENIERTVEDDWEETYKDSILNEKYTGPIDWPHNWRAEFIEVGAPPEGTISVMAGKRSPKSGWWFTPAQEHSRRYFKENDLFPEIKQSEYGATFWQWSPDQSTPSLS